MAGTVRIIGGQWKRRRLAVPDVSDLRPTPDRVRETLFNWLAPDVAGACCLDLFAGSGALGFEAASRGAARVVLVEQNTEVVEVLRQEAQTLRGKAIEVVQADALAYLKQSPEPFDIVFVDPPYGKNLVEVACRHLDNTRWLTPGALIYMEGGRRSPDPVLPETWQIARCATAGDVKYLLAERSVAHEAPTT